MSTSRLPQEEHPLDNLESRKSAKDEFYRFQLRQAKLQAVAALNQQQQFLTGQELNALNSMSEKEKVEIKALARLYSLADTSPEYLQLKAITGGKDREDIAEKLAKTFMEKTLVEDMMNRFVAPVTSKGIITGAQQTSRANFDIFGRQQ
jgi:hypothetical protein